MVVMISWHAYVLSFACSVKRGSRRSSRASAFLFTRTYRYLTVWIVGGKRPVQTRARPPSHRFRSNLLCRSARRDYYYYYFFVWMKRLPQKAQISALLVYNVSSCVCSNAPRVQEGLDDGPVHLRGASWGQDGAVLPPPVQEPHQAQL